MVGISRTDASKRTSGSITRLLLDAAERGGAPCRKHRTRGDSEGGSRKGVRDRREKWCEADGRVYPCCGEAERRGRDVRVLDKTVRPVLDRVDPNSAGAVLVGRVEHSFAYGTPARVRDPAAHDDGPALQGSASGARSAGVFVSSWCTEAYGGFGGVEGPIRRAAEIDRNRETHVDARVVLYNTPVPK